MRLLSGCAIGLATAAIVVTTPAQAIPITHGVSQPARGVLSVEQKQQRPRKDCTPYNGPYGFYGNVWCQPPNEMSYMRNLSSPWPQETPPSLKKVKPSSDTDW
jgi:hypothetical protein